jgi:hypothetical protein
MLSRQVLTAGLSLAATTFSQPLYATDIRFEGSLGEAYGRTDATVSVPVTPSLLLTVKSDALGGPGLAPGAALWVDGPLAAWFAAPLLNNISFSLQYQHFRNSASTTISASVPTAPAPVAAAVSLGSGLTSQNLLLNAAWRYNSGDMHPFVGAGAGGAVTDLAATLGLSTTPVIPGATPVLLRSVITKFNAAGQVFAGFDYDILQNLYVGMTGIYYATDTITGNFKHAKYTVDSNELAILGHVGWRF